MGHVINPSSQNYGLVVQRANLEADCPHVNPDSALLGHQVLNGRVESGSVIAQDLDYNISYTYILWLYGKHDMLHFFC